MKTDRAQSYRLGYSEEEAERLERQHRIWSGENRQFLARAGFARGGKVMDLGCGPGYTTLELADSVGPDGRVIAIDRDGERSLPLLRLKAAAAGRSNVDTVAADLEHFDLPPGSVDGVYGRWILMYLPVPAAHRLVQRVAAWLMPGGVCALAEFCNQRHACLHPHSDHMDAVNEGLLRALAGRRGCDPQIGNVLPGWLADAGLEVEVHVGVRVVRAITPEWEWAALFFRHHLPPLVREGYLARDLLDAFFADWDERSHDPRALFFYPPLMQVIGRRQ
ncbi:MAG: methyltransferase domain-containing protein [Acidobacteriota bacterium]|jgi:ubiquinone/menaquinone biosynthesis C-methylase UbiE